MHLEERGLIISNDGKLKCYDYNTEQYYEEKPSTKIFKEWMKRNWELEKAGKSKEKAPVIIPNALETAVLYINDEDDLRGVVVENTHCLCDKVLYICDDYVYLKNEDTTPQNIKEEYLNFISDKTRDFLVISIESCYYDITKGYVKLACWYLSQKYENDTFIRELIKSEKALLNYLTFNKEFMSLSDFSKITEIVFNYVNGFSLEGILGKVRVELIDVCLSKTGGDDRYYVDKLTENGAGEDLYIASIVPNSRINVYSDSGYTDCYALKRYAGIKIGRMPEEETKIRETLKAVYNKEDHFTYLLHNKLKCRYVDLDKYATVKIEYLKYWNMKRFESNWLFYNLLHRGGCSWEYLPDRCYDINMETIEFK